MYTSTTDTAAVKQDGSATISTLHPDMVETHILSRLGGPSLAAVSCASSTLRAISTQRHLWSHICRSTWPSTTSALVSDVISSFPDGGPRSFFAQSYSCPVPNTGPPAVSAESSKSLPPELISAVDIRHRNELIFSKIQETETVTGWFRCSPFRIDLLDPKNVVPTSLPHPRGDDDDDTCTDLLHDLTLSWILIDPIGRRAVNLSSHNPVSVQRHWLTGEVQVRFATILAGDQRDSPSRLVQCEVVVTCGCSDGGEMEVREVSVEVEDMDGKHLNGRESLVILERALEGKRGTWGKREKEMYRAFVEIRRERRERKVRREEMLDVLCVAVAGVIIFTVISVGFLKVVILGGFFPIG